jgi:hypothetical protein
MNPSKGARAKIHQKRSKIGIQLSKAKLYVFVYQMIEKMPF